jgi:hypothetical protein
MKRLARVVAVGVPHHVTQRGNGTTVLCGSCTKPVGQSGA